LILVQVFPRFARLEIRARALRPRSSSSIESRPAIFYKRRMDSSFVEKFREHATIFQ
jgi:hypothetical protein